MLPILVQFLKAILAQVVALVCTIVLDTIRRSMGEAHP